MNRRSFLCVVAVAPLVPFVESQVARPTVYSSNPALVLADYMLVAGHPVNWMQIGLSAEFCAERVA